MKYIFIFFIAIFAACTGLAPAPCPTCPVCPPGDSTVVVTPVDTDTTFKVGVNGFPWFPIRLLNENNIKWERVYCSSGWIWQPGGLAVQPMHQAETVENHGIDGLLTKAKQYGVTVLLTVHQCPEWYRNTGRGDGANDYAPIPAGAKRDNPASFKDYAGFLFQVAARYGRVKHPDNVLRVDVTPRWPGDILNEKKSGLELLKYLEPWNEEKWWKKGTTENEAYIEPETMAALMSATYDGHEGALGAGIGIKTADPSMMVVMPGLSDYSEEYTAKMSEWFAANRKDKKWACDVWNWHHYNNRGNKKGQYPAQWSNDGACLPKDDANFETVKEYVDLAKKEGKQLWVTETGADKVAPSGMLAKGVGKNNEQFQSDIIIASIQEYRKAGVSGVFIFTGPDDYGSADGGQFETSGMFSSEATGYRPFIAANEIKAYISKGSPLSAYDKLQPAQYYNQLDSYKKIRISAHKRPM